MGKRRQTRNRKKKIHKEKKKKETTEKKCNGHTKNETNCQNYEQDVKKETVQY